MNHEQTIDSVHNVIARAALWHVIALCHPNVSCNAMKEFDDDEREGEREGAEKGRRGEGKEGGREGPVYVHCTKAQL